jgi:hypothetical protein
LKGVFSSIFLDLIVHEVSHGNQNDYHRLHADCGDRRSTHHLELREQNPNHNQDDPAEKGNHRTQQAGVEQGDLPKTGADSNQS